jgi:hypothetical protein
MHRFWASGALLVVALAVAGLGATRASGFEGGLALEIPGVGNASGVDGPAPQVEVFGGRSGVRQGGTTWVEVRCTTSTAAGCSGKLEFKTGGGTAAATVPFELSERQSTGIHARLSRAARRRVSQPLGLKLVARACAVDSVGRTACDSAPLTVRSR